MFCVRSLVNVVFIGFPSTVASIWFQLSHSKPVFFVSLRIQICKDVFYCTLSPFVFSLNLCLLSITFMVKSTVCVRACMCCYPNSSDNYSYCHVLFCPNSTDNCSCCHVLFPQGPIIFTYFSHRLPWSLICVSHKWWHNQWQLQTVYRPACWWR
jgi:hypothetical protein